MSERTVRVGLMTYQREDGRYRLAYTGDVVQVHPDFLERFDRINVVQGQAPAPEPEAPAEQPAPEPVKKSAPRQSRRKTTEE